MTVPILLVEDDPSLTAAVARALRQRGFAVTPAATAGAALDVESSFALGVFDIDLPDGDGVETARELLDRQTVLFAVFFSATTDDARRTGARALGAFVFKSEGVNALLEAIDQSLEDALQTALCAGAEENTTSTAPSPRPPSHVRRRR